VRKELDRIKKISFNLLKKGEGKTGAAGLRVGVVGFKACRNPQLLPSGVKHGYKSIGIRQGKWGYCIDVLHKACAVG
jgi:hypothetical protein